jgi:hypothetical protein
VNQIRKGILSGPQNERFMACFGSKGGVTA